MIANDLVLMFTSLHLCRSSLLLTSSNEWNPFPTAVMLMSLGSELKELYVTVFPTLVHVEAVHGYIFGVVTEPIHHFAMAPQICLRKSLH